MTTLPQRLGALGLRSAVRTGAAAYWASWADTLPMMMERCPAAATKLLEELEKGVLSNASSCAAAAAARATLEHEGYSTCSWKRLAQGERPPQVDRPEPGEYRHGWQYHAAARRETHYGDGAVLANCDRPTQALLRSQAGRCAGCHLTLLPVTEELKWSSAKLRTLLLRRLRLPLDLDDRRCKCGGLLDSLGDHRAACSTVRLL